MFFGSPEHLTPLKTIWVRILNDVQLGPDIGVKLKFQKC